MVLFRPIKSIELLKATCPHSCLLAHSSKRVTSFTLWAVESSRSELPGRMGGESVVDLLLLRALCLERLCAVCFCSLVKGLGDLPGTVWGTSCRWKSRTPVNLALSGIYGEARKRHAFANSCCGSRAVKGSEGWWRVVAFLREPVGFT